MLRWMCGKNKAKVRNEQKTYMRGRTSTDRK